MWMLLEQVTQDEAEERDLTAVSWSKSANDIPADWKDIVGRRLDPDPNERLGLLELVNFWKTVMREDAECAPKLSCVQLYLVGISQFHPNLAKTYLNYDQPRWSTQTTFVQVRWARQR